MSSKHLNPGNIETYLDPSKGHTAKTNNGLKACSLRRFLIFQSCLEAHARFYPKILSQVLDLSQMVPWGCYAQPLWEVQLTPLLANSYGDRAWLVWIFSVFESGAIFMGAYASSKHTLIKRDPTATPGNIFSLKRFGGSQWRCCCSRPQPWPRELLQFSWRMVRRSFNILFGLESVSLAIWFSLMDLMAYYVLEIRNTDETVVGIEFSHAFKSSWPRSQLKGSSLLWRVMLSRTCTRSCRVMIFGHDIEATTFFCWSNRVAREVIWL